MGLGNPCGEVVIWSLPMAMELICSFLAPHLSFLYMGLMLVICEIGIPNEPETFLVAL